MFGHVYVLLIVAPNEVARNKIEDRLDDHKVNREIHPTELFDNELLLEHPEHEEYEVINNEHDWFDYGHSPLKVPS